MKENKCSIHINLIHKVKKKKHEIIKAFRKTQVPLIS